MSLIIGQGVLYRPGVNVSRNVGARHIDQQNKCRVSLNVLRISEGLFNIQPTERLF